MKTKITKVVKSIDIFGDTVSFSAKNGEKSFKTWLGALVTFFLYMLLASYSIKRFIVMINRDDTKFTETTEGNAENIDDSAKYLNDLNVTLAFRVLEITNQSTFKTLNKSDFHGYLDVRVSTESWFFDPENLIVTSDSTSIDYQKCSDSQLS